jgi:hypothetical protein
MRDTIVDRGLLRQWGELARQRWSDESFERDLSEKVDLAEGGAMFPVQSSCCRWAHPSNRRSSITWMAASSSWMNRKFFAKNTRIFWG